MNRLIMGRSELQEYHTNVNAELNSQVLVTGRGPIAHICRPFHPEHRPTRFPFI